MNRTRENPAQSLRRWQNGCALIGLLGAAAAAVGYFVDHRLFFEAWLLAWFYWFSLAVGCLGFYLIYRLTGGAWGEPLERIFLAGGNTFGALLPLFLPLLGGLSSLYPWTHTGSVTDLPKLLHKQGYLNPAFWDARAALYFLCWLALARSLLRAPKERVPGLSAAGLILLFLTVSFAAVDWLMSLEPLWYSTVYGLIILTGQGLSGFAFALLLLPWLRNRVPGWSPPLSPKVLKDLGNIQLTACLAWAYVSFVQWLILWIGNVPDTVTWYVSRAGRGWDGMAWLVFFGQFLVPFQLLLWQAFKEKPRNLAALGLALLVFHGIEVYWLVVPAAHPDRLAGNAMLLATFPAVGGLWLAWFFRQLRHVAPRSARSAYTPLLRELLHA